MSNSKIKQLEKTIERLQKELELSKEKYKNLEEQYFSLTCQIKSLLRNRFGQKSERFVDSKQLSLFDEPEEEEPAQKEIVNIASYQRKKRGGRCKSKNLPKREVIIPLKEEDAICVCGKKKTIIGYETKEIINHIPEIFEVIVEKREKGACPCGCDCSLSIAPKPNHILPKTQISESFLANIIVSKIEDRQPLYHLEKIFQKRIGINIPRNSMARWMTESAFKLQPLINLMKDEILDYDISALDATSLQVLREKDRPPTRKSYVYCFRGGTPNKKIVLYEYNSAEHKKFLSNWFLDYKGFIHADADPFFEDLAAMPGIVMNYCNAHARRKFEQITKDLEKIKASEGLAAHAMSAYQELYKIERLAKNKNMSPIERQKLRQEKSKPILEDHKKWLDKHFATVLPKSPLGKAISYCLNHWEGLIKFLEDGRLEIDNNLTEQAIKPFVMARKNFLFSCSVRGAKALCIHFSIIRTAILHGHNPYTYYVKILKEIPNCKTVEDYEALLPWNISTEQTIAKIA